MNIQEASIKESIEAPVIHHSNFNIHWSSPAGSPKSVGSTQATRDSGFRGTPNSSVGSAFHRNGTGHIARRLNNGLIRGIPKAKEEALNLVSVPSGKPHLEHPSTPAYPENEIEYAHSQDLQSSPSHSTHWDSEKDSRSVRRRTSPATPERADSMDCLSSDFRFPSNLKSASIGAEKVLCDPLKSLKKHITTWHAPSPVSSMVPSLPGSLVESCDTVPSILRNQGERLGPATTTFAYPIVVDAEEASHQVKSSMAVFCNADEGFDDEEDGQSVTEDSKVCPSPQVIEEESAQPSVRRGNTGHPVYAEGRLGFRDSGFVSEDDAEYSQDELEHPARANSVKGSRHTSHSGCFDSSASLGNPSSHQAFTLASSSARHD